MNTYKHLTIEERENARSLLAQGLNLMEIALKLKRYPPALSCEFRRNAYKNGNYTVKHVQKLSRKRRCNYGITSILKNEKLHRYVLERKIGRAVAQMSERVTIENLSFPIAYATIYCAVDSGVMTKQTKKLTSFKGEYKKHKSTEKRGEIQTTTSIHDRPASIETCLEVVHWESDTVFVIRKQDVLIHRG